MKTIRTAAILVFSIFFFASSAHAELNKEKRKDLYTLFKMTGVTEISQSVSIAVFQAYVTGIKQKLGKTIPEEAQKIMQEEYQSTARNMMPEVYEAVALSYDRYMTHEDIKNLIAFYSTESGKKAARYMPLITQETMSVGSAISRKYFTNSEFSKRVKTRIEKAGIKLE